MAKVKKTDFEYYSQITDCDELVETNGVLYGDEDNTKIYIGDKTEDLEETIKGVGLRQPIYVSEKYRFKENKKIHSGHRRKKTLTKMGMSHVPIKYIKVPEHDNSYDNIISLMAENQTRDRSAYEKYLSVVTLNEEYITEYGDTLDDDKISVHCSLSTTNIQTYKSAEKLRKTHPELWGRVESGKLSLSGAIDKSKNKPKEKYRVMSPDTLSIVTKDRVTRALNLTQLIMTQYSEIKVPDPLNPKDYWSPMSEFQQQTITAEVHEAFTKSLARVLVCDGFTDAVAGNEGLADLELKNNTVQIETKAAYKKPRTTRTEWSGSNKVKGAYYNLIKYNTDFVNNPLWFHAIVKVPFEAWVSGGAIKKLKDTTIAELIKNGEGVVLHGSIDSDGDIQMMPLVQN